jgi:hypothetical protein
LNKTEVVADHLQFVAGNRTRASVGALPVIEEAESKV